MESVKKIIALVVGSVFLAIGLNLFLIPQGLMEGGALGISLIVHYVTGTKVGLTFLLISIPIFMLTWVVYRPFFYNGIHGMLISALVIDLFAPLKDVAHILQSGPIASSAIGGIFIGIGTGLMLRRGISIGGTDLLAQLTARSLKINSGLIILLFDIIIVTVGSLSVPRVSLVLSLVTVCSVGLTISAIVSWNVKTVQSNDVFNRL
ncbi:YitT family protein [Sporosarcina gallistercoris]|uniref:YitT family protein n=1 Tax=Sporosarcina gallistercoris TaxID=2762245 RepID=A0ABR8PI68_9BACL|nr:YitT family protein [Sporosarcina gallistercoris]MBD7907862.1 YitT family protein [Sporosarcina gallistercoris]